MKSFSLSLCTSVFALLLATPMFAQYNSDFYYDTPNASTNQQVATEDL